MIGSRRTAIAASVIGALLVIAGVPTMAMGGEDASRERVTVQSADTTSTQATSDDVSAQKAKDDHKKDGGKEDGAKKDGAKKDGAKKDGAKKDDAKKDAAKKDAAKKDSDKKKDADDRKSAAEKKNADEKKSAEKKKDDAKKKKDGDKKDGDKKDDNKQASDRKRHDNNGRYGHGRNDNGRDGRSDYRKDERNHDGDRTHDGDRKHDGDRDEWKRRDHKDKHNRHWDRDRDNGRRHHYGWDTHRRYYQYGYYGPGYYDDCGYNGSSYGDNDYAYYGPDACRYEYGSYRSHFLVDMSWEEVIPDPRAGGSEARGAYGTANLDIDVPAGMVCFRLAYDGIDRAIGAQIHPGRRGEVGPSIVLLHVGRNGDDGCVRADPRILSEIQNDPRGYYLEVNDEVHGQAMRGQLDAPDYRNRY